MADGAQQDRVAVAAARVDRVVGQDLAGPQVALAAQVERHEVVVETLQPRDAAEDLQALGDHFRARPRRPPPRRS